MNEYTAVYPIRQELNKLRQSYITKPQWDIVRLIAIAYARLDIETAKLTGVKPDKNELLNWFKSFGKNYHSICLLTYYEAASGALSPFIR